ncbi:acyltransferase [Moraxella sp. Tifton1]|uniref:Acyltransferase n=1 Tax=Moraxella oculi TaxID=2940516 RepID=A0ABW8U4R6_9GAMM|nr:acyltransferase [Moraxella sp. Tifton1]MCL1623242.1 acyltransferase [Moraxella sp. Tifton1]
MIKTKRKTLPFFQKLHDTTPNLARKLSFVVSTGGIAANSLGLSVPIYAAGLAKVFGKSKVADDAIVSMADYWIRSNNFMIDAILPKKDWRISLPNNLKSDGKYLLICNHQSWVDTSIIQYVSEGILPITRFFAKHELLYIPVVGQAFYFLDFPMMKRHSKEQIAKNPALAHRDIAEARRACELLANKPFVLLNYLEGTRFTPAKHAKQQSPYHHLLKPKAGGLALAISSLGEKIDGILDMTLVYPDGIPEYGDLWQGKLTRLGVDIRHIEPNPSLFDALKNGEYDHNADIKAEFFKWLDDIWLDKDARINEMLADFQHTHHRHHQCNTPHNQKT